MTTHRPLPVERDALVEELLGEMGGWRGRDQLVTFEKWLRRSVSLTHLLVLAILDARGPISMSALAEVLDVSVASTTGIVSRLEKRGLVARSRGAADDLRIVLVIPTEQGRRVFEELEDQQREHFKRLLDLMTPEELAVLLDAVRAFSRARERLVRRESIDGPSG